jgi:hypothetical protein
MPPNPTRPCPQCGQDVRRAHRSAGDKLLSGMLRFVTIGRRAAQRHACTNCYWCGLRMVER